MAKILTIVPAALTPALLAELQQWQAAVPLDPDTEVAYRGIRGGPASFVSAHDWTLMEAAVLDAGLGAEAEGFDAIAIDSVADCGISALRSLTRMPAIALGKVSMLYALTLGSRFSVLVPWKPAAYRLKKAAMEYGLSAQCASVRSLEFAPEEGGTAAAKDLAILGRRAIEEDGADVLFLGTTIAPAAHQALAALLPVPVINPGPLGLKLAEAMLALGLTHSAKAYPEPLVRKEYLIRAMLDAAAAGQQ